MAYRFTFDADGNMVNADQAIYMPAYLYRGDQFMEVDVTDSQSASPVHEDDVPSEYFNLPPPASPIVQTAAAADTVVQAAPGMQYYHDPRGSGQGGPPSVNCEEAPPPSAWMGGHVPSAGAPGMQHQNDQYGGGQRGPPSVQYEEAPPPSAWMGGYTPNAGAPQTGGVPIYNPGPPSAGFMPADHPMGNNHPQGQGAFAFDQQRSQAPNYNYPAGVAYHPIPPMYPQAPFSNQIQHRRFPQYTPLTHPQVVGPGYVGHQHPVPPGAHGGYYGPFENFPNAPYYVPHPNQIPGIAPTARTTATEGYARPPSTPTAMFPTNARQINENAAPFCDRVAEPMPRTAMSNGRALPSRVLSYGHPFARYGDTEAETLPEQMVRRHRLRMAEPKTPEPREVKEEDYDTTLSEASLSD